MPNSLTLGEALVIGQAISVAVCDLLLQTLCRRVDPMTQPRPPFDPAVPPAGFSESDTVMLATKALVVAGVAVFVIGQAACFVLQSKREAVANDMEITEVAAVATPAKYPYHRYAEPFWDHVLTQRSSWGPRGPDAPDLSSVQ